MVLSTPTRSFVNSTPLEQLAGFLAACPFTLIYIIAPMWVISSLLLLLIQPFWKVSWLLVAPPLVSLALPASFARVMSKHVLGSWACRQIPKYFSCAGQ